MGYEIYPKYKKTKFLQKSLSFYSLKILLSLKHFLNLFGVEEIILLLSFILIMKAQFATLLKKN